MILALATDSQRPDYSDISSPGQISRYLAELAQKLDQLDHPLALHSWSVANVGKPMSEFPLVLAGGKTHMVIWKFNQNWHLAQW